MSYDVTVYRGATSYSLTSGAPYWCESITGLGLPPIRLLKERGPQQHGSTVVGYRLDERYLNLALMIAAATEELAAAYRDEVGEIFKPIDGVPISVRVTREDGTMRQIDTYSVGSIDLPNTRDGRMAGRQFFIAQLEAPDPIPYDPTLRNIVFDTAGGGGYFVPWEVPFLYTTGDSIDTVFSLEYSGAWEVYPKIYVTGPATNLVITNETINKVLDFTGVTIAGGVTYEIDLRYGYKIITDHLGALQNGKLTDDSDLATWRIVPSPLAPGGINDIRVEVASDATIATQIRVEYYDRHPVIG